MRQAAAAGARAIWPLAIAAFPFGLVYGAAVSDADVSQLAGVAASWLVLAGASQLAALNLIDTDANPWIAIAAGVVINLRFVLYSIALAPAMAKFPTRWRFGLPYLLTDQVAALAMHEFEERPDPIERRWFYLGAALLFSSSWWVGTIVGTVFGGQLPDALNPAFAVPAMFIALLVPSIANRPALVAAITGGTVAVLAAPLPSGLNIIFGALAGIGAGRLAIGPSAPEVTP